MRVDALEAALTLAARSDPGASHCWRALSCSACAVLCVTACGNADRSVIVEIVAAIAAAATVDGLVPGTIAITPCSFLDEGIADPAGPCPLARLTPRAR